MKYILVGGNPFRMYTGTTTFTSLKVVATCQTKDEARQLWNQHYEDCSGLMLIIDAETGQPADMSEEPKEPGIVVGGVTLTSDEYAKAKAHHEPRLIEHDDMQDHYPGYSDW